MKTGTYYTAQHLDENDEYVMYFHQDQPHLIRARLHSRYQSSTYHHLWIKYTADVNNPSAIVGYYCQCKAGQRTGGCCSHLASVNYLFCMTSNLNSHDSQQVNFIDAAAELGELQDTHSENSNTSTES